MFVGSSILNIAEIGYILYKKRNTVISSITDYLKNFDHIPSTDIVYIFNPIKILQTFFPNYK